jgi:MFS family permease
MLSIVLIVLTYNLTHSNFAVSILVMALLLPQIFFSFLGGIIADAKNKRKILLFGNLARALILVLFFFVKDTLAFIYIFMLAIAIVTQFYIPAEAPIIPHLVRKKQLLTANAIFGVSLFGSILVGYVAAGPAMRFFGNDGVFLFMASLFIIAYLCVMLMPDVAPSVKKLRTEKTFFANTFHLYRLVWKEFHEVIELLKSKRNVASSLLFLALSQVIILILATIVPDYAQKTLLVHAEDISLVIFAPAALGMLIASFMIGSRFTRSSEEKIISVGIILSSIVLFLFATIDLQHYFNLVYLSLGITLIAGIANACIFIPAQTIVQRHVGHKSLSKVFGLLYLAVGIVAFVPIILTGVFADVLGVRVVLLGIGMVLLLLGIVKIFIFKNRFL